MQKRQSLLWNLLWYARNILALDRPSLALVRKVLLSSSPKVRAAYLAFLQGPTISSSGWLESFTKRQPVDAQSGALPWFCYPAIHFLERRLPKRLTVLECGAGGSTRWWGDHAAQVLSLESNKVWYDRVRQELPGNVDLRYASGGDLPRLLDEMITTNRRFDILVIDNIDRGSVAVRAKQLLADSGIVVFDNSDEPLYRPSVQFILEDGFREIEFHGSGPINTFTWSTSILYRNENTLGI